MPSEDLSRVGLLQAFDGVGQDEEASCEARAKRGNILRRSSAILSIVLVVALTVGAILAVVRRTGMVSSGASLTIDDVVVGNKTYAGRVSETRSGYHKRRALSHRYDLSKTSDRAALIDLIKSASHQSPDPATTQGDAAVRILVVSSRFRDFRPHQVCERRAPTAD
jgi:hypothetical protein